MGFFKETADASESSPNLHLAVSTDGLIWIPLNQNNYVMKPEMGTRCLRDPFFYRMPDETFTIVSTDNWSCECIHIWSTPDLINFSNERLFRVNTNGMPVWAPEIFYDVSRNQFAIIWSGMSDRNRIYVNYTKDFSSVTTPKVFFDPGYSVNDVHIEVNVDGYNYLYYKNETDFKLYGTRSATLNPGSFDSNTYTTGYEASLDTSHVMSPILIRNNFISDNWWLWGNSLRSQNVESNVWKTNDLSKDSWEVIDNREYTPPLNAKYATIVPVTDEEYDNLISKWGTTSWDILKSYKYPNCYVRHQKLVGKISDMTLDPIEDMQWIIVPGLADSGGISFKAVNMPNYYLRHRNYSMILSEYDTSTSFKSDATFYPKKGFADSSWQSFQSYNYPERYIRLSEDSTLGIDSITNGSSDSEKEGATFKAVYSSVKKMSTGTKPEEKNQKRDKHYTKNLTVYGTESTINLKFEYQPVQKDLFIYLFDLSGNMVATLYKGRMSSNHLTLPLKDKYVAGTYVLYVMSGNVGIMSKRVILGGQVCR